MSDQPVNWFWRRQGAQKIAEIAGQGINLEPGHHYEWAFLLDRWSKLTGRNRPSEVPRLIAFADANGLDRKRRVAVNGIKQDGSVADPIARLWPQTERIRAYLIDRHEGDEARLREAIESLWRYLDAPLPGLWYENLAADCRFVVEAAPATSLYQHCRRNRRTLGVLWGTNGSRLCVGLNGEVRRARCTLN